MKGNERTPQGMLLALTSLLVLSACGGDSSSDVPGEPELGEKSDLLVARTVSGAMCPELGQGEIEVYRNGNLVTIKAPRQSGEAEHNPDPIEWNDAHCRMAFSVRSETDFLRRLAGGSISGRYAERTKTDGGYMFSGIVRYVTSWTGKNGSQKGSEGMTRVSDRDGRASFVSEFTNEMGANGSLTLAVEINPEHEGYPVAYTWDGLVRFEITPTR